MKVRVPKSDKENKEGVNNHKLAPDEYQLIFGNMITVKNMSPALYEGRTLGLIFRKGNKPVGFQLATPGEAKLYNDPKADNVLEFMGKPTMALLDHKGEVQMSMEGGELIFSRPSTKKILDLAAKAVDEESLFDLGEYVYNERKAQMKRKPQYVKN